MNSERGHVLIETRTVSELSLVRNGVSLFYNSTVEHDHPANNVTAPINNVFMTFQGLTTLLSGVRRATNKCKLFSLGDTSIRWKKDKAKELRANVLSRLLGTRKDTRKLKMRRRRDTVYKIAQRVALELYGFDGITIFVLGRRSDKISGFVVVKNNVHGDVVDWYKVEEGSENVGRLGRLIEKAFVKLTDFIPIYKSDYEDEDDDEEEDDDDDDDDDEEIIDDEDWG